MKTNRKIMVVDDDPVVGKSIERVLATKGYAVINCQSGEEALAKLHNEEYDAVFTDLKMSGMDGIEVANQVKATQPWMPVVLITGFGDANAEARAINAGVQQFIHKPLSPDMIESMAAQAMQAKETVEEFVVEKVIETQATEVTTSTAKNIALFLASPFIGLLYLIAMPLVGLAMLAYYGVKYLAKSKLVQFAAAPFIGLAFIVVSPIVGLGAMAYVGGKALFK